MSKFERDMRLYDSCDFFGLGDMQFVDGFVVLTWSVSS